MLCRWRQVESKFYFRVLLKPVQPVVKIQTDCFGTVPIYISCHDRYVLPFETPDKRCGPIYGHAGCKPQRTIVSSKQDRSRGPHSFSRRGARPHTFEQLTGVGLPLEARDLSTNLRKSLLRAAQRKTPGTHIPQRFGRAMPAKLVVPLCIAPAQA